MSDVFKILIIVLIFLIAMSTERYEAEKDTVEQLIINGRTNFIFYKDISVENVKILKDEK